MAISNIVVNDDAPTPVAHTFVPVQDGADAKYVNEAGALTLKGQETAGFSIKRANDSRSANTARVTLWDPVEVVAVDGTASVSHGNSADTRFNFAQKATAQERKNTVKLHINMLLAKYADIHGLTVQF